MKILIVSFLVFFYLDATSQTLASNDTTNINSDSVYSRPDTPPKLFKGTIEVFLEKNMTYPKDAIKNEIQGTVIVKFIIEKDGSVTNIEAESGPKALREDAISLIKKTSKWSPAIDKGKIVRSAQRQPIVYRLER
jgi:TonB family protein